MAPWGAVVDLVVTKVSTHENECMYNYNDNKIEKVWPKTSWPKGQSTCHAVPIASNDRYCHSAYGAYRYYSFS